jgi:glyoxylase-like metal-dependent hydrolase (beta-lactamase superfamily II)
MEARIDRVITPGPRQPNAWLVGDDSEVIVVDPGGDPATVREAVGDRDVLAVICSHGHPAHAAAAREIAGDDAPVALHRADLLLWRETQPGESPDIEMEDGGIFGVGGVTLEVIHAPGHTPGSVCLYCEELGAVLTGDVVLADGPARHDGEFPDFPGQLSAIGEKVLTLPADTRVLPGHGEETTVAVTGKRFDIWAATPTGPEELVD